MIRSFAQSSPPNTAASTLSRLKAHPGIRYVLNAGVWFTSAGLPAYASGLGKNRLIVNLWHGVPLKKIALLDPNLKKMARVYFRKIFSENYTYVLTTSHALVPLMAKTLIFPKI